MRLPKVAFIAPREVSRMANDMFSGIGVAGDSAFFTRSDEGYAFFTRSDEGYFVSDAALLPVSWHRKQTGKSARPTSSTKPSAAANPCQIDGVLLNCRPAFGSLIGPSPLPLSRPIHRRPVSFEFTRSSRSKDRPDVAQPV